jgi:N-acetylglucosamine kinase
MSRSNDILPHIYAKFDKTKFAGFCNVVCRGAAEGDALCCDVLDKTGRDLARHIVALGGLVAGDMKTGAGWSGVDIVCTGSVWKSFALFKKAFLEVMHTSDDAPSTFR